jgi:hypothetical protein
LAAERSAAGVEGKANGADFDYGVDARIQSGCFEVEGNEAALRHARPF